MLSSPLVWAVGNNPVPTGRFCRWEHGGLWVCAYHEIMAPKMSKRWRNCEKSYRCFDSCVILLYIFGFFLNDFPWFEHVNSIGLSLGDSHVVLRRSCESFPSWDFGELLGALA